MQLVVRSLNFSEAWPEVICTAPQVRSRKLLTHIVSHTNTAKVPFYKLSELFLQHFIHFRIQEKTL